MAIVGPPKVGKSTLLQALIKNFTRQNITSIQGPVTIVTGKIFSFSPFRQLIALILQFYQVKFWTEVYQGAKLFYLSGQIHGTYPKNEIKNLGRVISFMKFRPLLWRSTHLYVVVGRLDIMTTPSRVHENPKCNIYLYGFVRGVHLRNHCSIHIPGAGDFRLKDVSFLADPCPLSDKRKKSSLIEKEKLICAPMSGVSGIIYDKNSIYIELGCSHSNNKQNDPSNPKTEVISSLMKLQETLDAQMSESRVEGPTLAQADDEDDEELSDKE